MTSETIWWMTRVSGRVWHAYVSDPPSRSFEGWKKRQMICGRWRRLGGMGGIIDQLEPLGEVCEDCDVLAFHRKAKAS